VNLNTPSPIGRSLCAQGQSAKPSGDPERITNCVPNAIPNAAGAGPDMTPAATTDIPRPRVRFEAYVPNREAAERFINTIARSLDTRLCWLFHDTKELVEEHGLPPMSERTTPPVFSGAVNGTLAEVWDRIVATQAAGGSVSLRLNVRPPNADGNGGGLEVYYFRAFYLDFDCDAAATNAKLDAMRVCPPTVLTNSRRGGHPYWALQNNPEANTISESEWRAVQAALTEHFGGDPNLKHPGSQLRLPGTWNFKDPQKPHLLTAFIDPSRRYTPAQVLAAFNLTPVEPPPRREPRPLTGALREAVEKWMFDHGADMEVRKHARCPVCEGDGGCKPYDESQTRLICFSTHHEATGIGTQVGTGFVFSALDIARGDTPLSAFLRQQKDEDGSPYLVDERDGNDSESCEGGGHRLADARLGSGGQAPPGRRRQGMRQVHGDPRRSFGVVARARMARWRIAPSCERTHRGAGRRFGRHHRPEATRC